MTDVRLGSRPVAPRAAIGWGLLRALASTVLLGALYFVVPLDRMDGLPLGVGLAVAIVALAGVTAWQVHEVIEAPFPAVRAVEALAVTAPLFLLLFAASYYLLSREDPGSFDTEVLTRTDALYFTVTVFATVGFGDLVPVTQLARRLVTVQMLLNLVVIGLGIRVFVGAVARGRSRQDGAGDDSGGRPAGR